MTPPDGAPTLTLTLAGEAETARLGAVLARHVAPGDVITLAGDLGSGKTTLARGFLAAWGHQGEVPSPTFTLVQAYDTQAGPVFHIDAYRLKRAEEIWELGFEDALETGVTLLEWPERVAGVLPDDRLEVAFRDGASRAERTVQITAHGALAERFDELRAELGV